MALEYPSLIPGVFAASANSHEDIPDTDAAEGRMAWDVGFPAETSQPIAAGGVPPRRLDMNGLGNRLSQHILWQQSGGLYNWNASLDYPAGAHVLGSNGQEYIALAANGPSTSNAMNPVSDVNFTVWKSFVRSLVDIIYPVGSIYMSVNNVSPATLFGGSWTQIQGRFLLAAGGNYGLGSQGGAATKQLSITEMPAHIHNVVTQDAGGHVHVATNSNNGAHTHTVTVNSNGAHTHATSGTAASNGVHTHNISITNGAQSAGAHTHSVTVAEKTVTVTTGSTSIAHNHAVTFPKTTFENATSNTGAHTHTRGTMDITGRFAANGLMEDVSYTSGAFSIYNTSSGWGDPDKTGSVTKGLQFTASGNWTGSTSSNGNHRHNITIPATSVNCSNAGGSHTHSVSVTVPAQNVTAASAGAHTHNVSGATVSAGAHTHTVSGTAASAGLHNHVASTASAGAHTHTITVQNNGVHQHNVTVNSTGGGAAFSIMPPYLAVNVWQRTA